MSILITSVLVSASHGVINLPGSNLGSDLVLNVTENETIDLGLASNGAWDDPSAIPGFGVYDSDRWAVVFKYSEVNIDPGATVRFLNHPSGAPVVWLVNGNVNVDGEITLKGESGGGALGSFAEGGPGGFRGGTTYNESEVENSSGGFGPGGGGRNQLTSSASYASEGVSRSNSTISAVRPFPPYGNSSLIPLIGGSGGGTKNQAPNKNPGAGAGALLIACEGMITVDGVINAEGNATSQSDQNTSGGSGGGVRLVSDQISGQGLITVLGFNGSGEGRIRLEANSVTGSLITRPPTHVVPVVKDQPADTARIWPPDDHPTCRIVGVEGGSFLTGRTGDPRHDYAFTMDAVDVSLSTQDPVDVTIETTNVQPDSVVELRVQPLSHLDPYSVTAEHQTGDTWIARDIDLPGGTTFLLHVRALTQ